MRHRARIAKAEQQLQALQPEGKAYLVIEPEDWSRLDELGYSWSILDLPKRLLS